VTAPRAAEGLGRLPSCALGDVYTVPRGYDDWQVTLVDRLLRVGADYVPPDLVDVRSAGIAGAGKIRAVAMDDTRAMARAAAAAGAPIGVWSGYRSYREQTGVFTMYSNENGFESAITYSQRPGHSEHQLGLGVDFMSRGGGSPLPGDWAKTPAGAWMRDNSWKFGWVNSYPRGKGGTRWNEQACFRYEPWHYRYLGRDIAAKVHRSGLTIREYLWRNHTMLDRKGKPVPTPAATAPSVPSSQVTPTATPAPSTPARDRAATSASTSPPSVAQPASSGTSSASDWLARVGVFAVLGALLAAAAFAVRRALRQ
jgi:D-alanyl-D-alanine carboxypeptidase